MRILYRSASLPSFRSHHCFMWKRGLQNKNSDSLVIGESLLFLYADCLQHQVEQERGGCQGKESGEHHRDAGYRPRQQTELECFGSARTMSTGTEQYPTGDFIFDTEQFYNHWTDNKTAQSGQNNEYSCDRRIAANRLRYIHRNGCRNGARNQAAQQRRIQVHPLGKRHGGQHGYNRSRQHAKHDLGSVFFNTGKYRYKGTANAIVAGCSSMDSKWAPEL